MGTLRRFGGDEFCCRSGAQELAEFSEAAAVEHDEVGGDQDWSDDKCVQQNSGRQGEAELVHADQ